MNKTIGTGSAVVFRHGNRRVQDILLALAKEFTSVKHIPFIGISFLAEPLEPDVLELARRSTFDKPAGAFLRRLQSAALKLQYNYAVRKLRKLNANCLIVWNGTKDERLLLCHAARAAGMTIVYGEDAPLAKRISVDFQGVNFANSLPRTKEFYLKWSEEADTDAWSIAVARSSLNARLARAGSKVGQDKASADLAGQNYIFCPLQVPGDSQLTVFGDWVPTIDTYIDVLAEVSKHLPDGWSLRVKEHPTSNVSFISRLTSHVSDKFVIDNATDTFEQVEHSKAVLTINSSVGLQSFLFDKPVITLGKAFYSFSGLTHQASSIDELKDILGTPDDLTFDKTAREAFLNYLIDAYFPTETSILTQEFTLQDVSKRDAMRDKILAEIGV